MNKPTSVAEYFDGISDPMSRQGLERIRQIARECAPHAQEVLSYGMPAFRGHRILFYIANFKNHWSLFPGGVTEEIRAIAGDLCTSKGTIQFAKSKPLPEEIVRAVMEIKVRNDHPKKK